MPVRVHLAGAAIAATLCTAFAASAQAPDAWTACTKTAETAPDVVIEGCSAVIKDGAEDKKLSFAHGNRAVAYFMKHDVQQAIADLREASRIDPQMQLGAMQFCAVAVLKQKDVSGLAYCDEALRANPKNAAAYGILADHALRNRDYDAVIKNLNEAVRISGDIAPTIKNTGQMQAFSEQQARFLNARGAAYAVKGDSDRAFDDFSEALRLNPGFTDALQSRASLYEAKRQYAKAMHDYEDLVRLDPGNASAWNSSCWLHAVVGQLVRALNDCNESLRLAPNTAVTLDSRGLVNLKQNAFAAAIDDYTAALKLNPKLPTSLYGRGLAKRKRNDKAGADADIAAAIAIAPGVAELFASYGIN